MDITIVEQPVPMKRDHFDFLNYDLYDYLKYFQEVPRSFSTEKVKNYMSNHTNCFILNYAGYDTWKILAEIIPKDYELLKLSSEYTCPFTNYKHVSLYPVFILTENPLDYVKGVYSKGTDLLPWYSDMACDASWNYTEEIFGIDYHRTKISKSFLGAGFTQMFYPNDGHSNQDLVSIQLSNGDTLVLLITKWYNK